MARLRYVSPFRIARIYAGLGEKELVFTWLRKGYDHSSDHPLWLGVDPTFDSVRSDPRFAERLRRVGPSTARLMQSRGDSARLS